MGHRKEEVLHGLPAALPQMVPLGWMTLTHTSLVAAAPSDAGVTEEEEGEAHPNLGPVGGNWVAGT